MGRSTRWFPSAVAIAACGLFVIAGVAFVPLLGLENDESLFGSALYSPQVLYSVRLFGGDVPLMLMSYVGALKGILYAPVFRLWTPGLYSIRVPMVAIGSLTVWLFFLLLRRIAGGRVAAIGAALLATDSLFFLTTVFDWGPVALQHLFLVSGGLLCVRFAQGGSILNLSGGFLLFGLGMWDKALFEWMLSGLVVATLVVLPKEVARLWTWRRAAAAVGCFALGAFPLLLYNATHHWETFRANSSFAPAGIVPKFSYLMESTRDGIYAWMIDSSGPPPMSPLGPAFLLSAVLWPLLWRRERVAARAMLFAVVCMTVAWLQMAVTGVAGASVHHTVLLWPLPQLFVAMALGAQWPVPARRIATVVTVLMVAWNLRVLGQHYAQTSRNGGSLWWNDAIDRASTLLEVETSDICLADWGMVESLVLLNHGSLAIVPVWDIDVKRPLTPTEKQALRERMASSRSVFLTHTEGNEFVAGNRARLLALADEFGLQREIVRTIQDSQGKPRLEVMKFRSRTGP